MPRSSAASHVPIRALDALASGGRHDERDHTTGDVDGPTVGRARVIRVGVVVLPLLASVAMAWLLSGVLPKPHSFVMGIARWFAIALVSTLVLISIDKLARRLLPLATLFGLTLAFPGSGAIALSDGVAHGLDDTAATEDRGHRVPARRATRRRKPPSACSSSSSPSMPTIG